MVSKNDKFGNTKNTILKKTRMTILNNTLRDPLPGIDYCFILQNKLRMGRIPLELRKN